MVIGIGIIVAAGLGCPIGAGDCWADAMAVPAPIAIAAATESTINDFLMIGCCYPNGPAFTRSPARAVRSCRRDARPKVRREHPVLRRVLARNTIRVTHHRPPIARSFPTLAATTAASAP